MADSSRVKKRFSSLLAYLWAFALLIIAFIALLLFFATSPGIMSRFFTIYSDGALHGIDPAHYPLLAKNITGYLNGSLSSMVITLPVNGIIESIFSPKELTHMADITSLITFGKRVLLFGGLFLLVAVALYAFKQNLVVLIRALKHSCIITLGVMVLLAFWVLIDFDSLFVLFHKILFTNDLWLLNPAQDKLIQLMPLAFFVGYGKALVVSYGLLVCVFLFLSSLLSRIFSPLKE